MAEETTLADYVSQWYFERMQHILQLIYFICYRTRVKYTKTILR